VVPRARLESARRRPGLRAAAIDATAVGLVGLLAVVLRIDPPLEPGGLAAASAEVPWLRLLTLVPALLLMLAKHRAPVAALVAGTVVLAVDQALGGSLGVLLAFFDLLYNATQRVSRPALRVLGRLVTGAVVLAGVVTAVVTRDPAHDLPRAAGRCGRPRHALLVGPVGAPAARAGRGCGRTRAGRRPAGRPGARATAAGGADEDGPRPARRARRQPGRDQHERRGRGQRDRLPTRLARAPHADRDPVHRRRRPPGDAGDDRRPARPGADPGRTAPARLEHLDETLAGVRATGREVDVLLDGVPAPGSLRERPELVDLPAAVAQAAHRITTRR
jgi:hypothetical protein